MIALLEPYVVLDLTDGRASLASRILADMGATVILVEPPGGRSERFDPEDANSEPAKQLAPSAGFHVHNRGKQSVMLDLATPDGRQRILELAGRADFLFENGEPGAAEAAGLGYRELSAVNPSLIYVSISPFGQDGPYAKRAATDLTLSALGGLMAVTGDRERRPVRISVPQVWLHASAEAALAALVAHHRRVACGAGAWIDVSAQTAVLWTLLNATTAYPIQGRNIERDGSTVNLGNTTFPVLFPAKDGWVVILVNSATLPTLVPLLVTDGLVPDLWLLEEDWPTYDRRRNAGQPTKVGFDEVIAAVGSWTRSRRSAELFELGLKIDVNIMPVNDIPALLEFSQFEDTGYWTPLSVGPVEVKAPGPWVRLSMSPLALAPSAPQPGEQPAPLPPASIGRRTTPTRATVLPFEGLKIADFSWVGVGPITAKYFADHGATVVKIESERWPDRLRLAGPFAGGIPGLNRSQFFGSFNTSKLSASIDLKTDWGKEIARRFLHWADVAIESFTTGTMARLGLDYESAAQANPRLIMASTTLFGRKGRGRSLGGFGYHGSAASGFTAMTGWPDREPAGPYNAYTDTIAPRFLAAAIMAALEYRGRTGRGQRITQSQVETATHFQGPELVQYQLDGSIVTRSGNDDSSAFPHDVFPCLGDDEWCAIAIETDKQWLALCDFIAKPSLKLLLGCESRRNAAAEVNEDIAAWTRTRSPREAMNVLAPAGIPAGAVQRSSDLISDPQLAHRGFFCTLAHPEMGDVPYEGHQFRFQDCSNGPRTPAPILGRDTEHVLLEFLGMTREEYLEARRSGALA